MNNNSGAMFYDVEEPSTKSKSDLFPTHNIQSPPHQNNYCMTFHSTASRYISIYLTVTQYGLKTLYLTLFSTKTLLAAIAPLPPFTLPNIITFLPNSLKQQISSFSISQLFLSYTYTYFLLYRISSLCQILPSTMRIS